MAEKILINGKTLDQISILDRGLNYGDGLFETIAFFQNELVCWDDHIARLIRGCERLKMPVPDIQILKKDALFLVTSNEEAVVKIILTRGQGGRGYALPESVASTRIVAIYPWPKHPPENSTSGISTRLCQFRYSPNAVLAGIKHLNRLEQVLARSEWNDIRISEGIVMDTDDNVIEGTMSNLFLVKNDVLFTPDLSLCGIEGIIRQKIIDLATTLKLELNIQKISLQALYEADEVFICNSIIGVWPVIRIDNHEFKLGKLTAQFRQELIRQHIIVSAC